MGASSARKLLNIDLQHSIRGMALQHLLPPLTHVARSRRCADCLTRRAQAQLLQNPGLLLALKLPAKLAAVSQLGGGHWPAPEGLAGPPPLPQPPAGMSPPSQANGLAGITDGPVLQTNGRHSSMSLSSTSSLGELAGANGAAAAAAAMAAGAGPAGGGELGEQPAGEEPAQRKVVVLGIPWQTEDATLHAHFSRHGMVEEAQIMREKYTGEEGGREGGNAC